MRWKPEKKCRGRKFLRILYLIRFSGFRWIALFAVAIDVADISGGGEGRFGIKSLVFIRFATFIHKHAWQNAAEGTAGGRGRGEREEQRIRPSFTYKTITHKGLCCLRASLSFLRRRRPGRKKKKNKKGADGLV